MDNLEERLHLYSTDVHITNQKNTVFRVESGTVLVYIAPLKNNQPERRILLCEVPNGKMIPSFCYEDEEHKQWRFIFVTKKEADLLCLKDKMTSVLQKRFAKFANLPELSHEGFSNSLIEYYKYELLKDNVFIERGKKDEPEIKIATYGVIKQVFDDDVSVINCDNSLYQAVLYACRKTHVDIIDFDRINTANKERITVADIAYASRFISREIVLEKGWHKKDSGTIISEIEEIPVACVADKRGKYVVYYGNTGKTEIISDEIANKISPRATVINSALPTHSLEKRDLLEFAKHRFKSSDLIIVIALGIIGALIGTLIPILNQIIYDDYIPLGAGSQLIQICLIIATFMLSSMFFDVVKRVSEFRIGSHIAYSFQVAVYYRLFHLPEGFFRSYDSADLAQRVGNVSGCVRKYVEFYVVSLFTVLFSLVYLYRMFRYSAKLGWVSITLLIVYAIIVLMLNMSSLKYIKRIEENKGDASAKLYQFLSGIEKIRIAGVESRVAFQYLSTFSEKQKNEIKKNYFDTGNIVLSGAIGTIVSMANYFVIWHSKTGISTGEFMAFCSAFSAFSASVLQMISSWVELYSLKPNIKRIQPVISTAIEDDDNCEQVSRLDGEISLYQVRFAYNDTDRNVIDGIDLSIKPGEYLGIVGPSGCGKSTLLKLLLGFEKVNTGRVCYDGKDINSLDKRTLRKSIGVVLQNGKLIAGSIYDNITITAPEATMKEVQEVVRAVGLEEDIAQMPMGLHTVLSESAGTISGGQQQRILIARAIISHPSILIFDEATSALDNLTQAAVSESLDQMNVTRIVVAHRLSTIRNCDRIIVLNDGKIVEEGNYQTLMALGGLFAQLGSRQLAE